MCEDLVKAEHQRLSWNIKLYANNKTGYSALISKLTKLGDFGDANVIEL